MRCQNQRIAAHRLILTPEARMRGMTAEGILRQLLDTLAVPGKQA